MPRPASSAGRDEGRQYPPPAGTGGAARFIGAGWPDYPWLFATDGEYTAFATVARSDSSSRSRTTCARCAT